MLEMILDTNVLFILMGVSVVVGIISKFVVGISLKRLTRAASNMGKSNHSLMKLVRAKFEHACMVSDKVQNVEVFVEKYLFEYRIGGITLHRWRRFEKAGAWGCALLGVLAAVFEYLVYGMGDALIQSAALGIGLGIVLTVLRMLTDEAYRLEMIRTYMVDYLENVCAHRYEKQKDRMEIKEQSPALEGKAEEVSQESVEHDLFGGVTKAFDQMFEMDEDQVKDQKITENERESILQGAFAEEKQEKPKAADVKKQETARKETPSRAARKKETTEEKPRSQVPKEVAIREILEEFLA